MTLVPSIFQRDERSQEQIMYFYERLYKEITVLFGIGFLMKFSPTYAQHVVSTAVYETSSWAYVLLVLCFVYGQGDRPSTRRVARLHALRLHELNRLKLCWRVYKPCFFFLNVPCPYKNKRNEPRRGRCGERLKK